MNGSFSMYSPLSQYQPFIRLLTVGNQVFPVAASTIWNALPVSASFIDWRTLFRRFFCR